MRLGARAWAATAASAADHQQGSSKSHEPIGRSRRDSRRYGRSQEGASVSTQLPVESATEPVARIIYLASGLPVSVSKVPWPVLVFLAVSSFGVPMASLSVGTFGAGAGAQTTSLNFRVFSCVALADWIAWGGTPHHCWFVSRNFTTAASAV